MYCREVDGNGRRRSYNLGTIKIDGNPMLRPKGGKTVWWYDPDPDDGYHWHLEDTDGTQYARFKTREEIESKSAIKKYPARESDFDKDDPDRENYVNCGCPTELVPDPDLSREHWAVVIIPDGTSCAEDLSIIHHGEEIAFDEIGDITDLNNTEDLITVSGEGPVRNQGRTTTEPEPEPEPVKPEPDEEDNEESEPETQSKTEKFAALGSELD